MIRAQLQRGRRTAVIAVTVVACLCAALAATASANIRGTNCHVSAHYAPASGSVSCSGHYSVAIRVCVQVRGKSGKWFVIKGDCSRASGATPGKISASVPQFKAHCNRTYRVQAIGTAKGHRSTAYQDFGTTCIG